MVGDSTPRFAIPERPRRRYPRGGGVEYEGETVFVLEPGSSLEDDALVELLRSVLAAEEYRFGDWFDLPMPLYIVHDDVTGDTFRVAVRDGTVEFHVLPATNAPGLRRLYERLRAESDWTWTVDRRTGASAE